MTARMESIRAALAEFLAAPSIRPALEGGAHTGPWTNRDVVEAVLGRSDMRDAAAFDAVGERAGRRCETFAEAFAACCVARTKHGERAVGGSIDEDGRRVGGKTRRSTQYVRDWADFDLATLRECCGGELRALQLPERAMVAALDEETAGYYVATASALDAEQDAARVLALSCGLSWPLDDWEVYEFARCA